MHTNSDPHSTLRQRLTDSMHDRAVRWAIRRTNRLVAKGRVEEAEVFARSFIQGALGDRSPAVLDAMDQMKAQNGGKVTL